MSYFVTGATGFIGRHLVQELVEHRDGDIFVLCRKASLPRIEALAARWGTDRVQPVVGDLTKPSLGVDPKWVKAHAGSIDHFFHVAAVYDMTADDEANQAANVDGTEHALQLARKLQVGRFHQVSSVAVAGDHRGVFDESMFDEGQPLPSAYHRTKYESERLVRESDLPWRVYRPSVVVGHSETGVMDKVDGPYYFFPMLKFMRDRLPAWLPLMGIDLGDTNVVPVDYVAKAMDHLAHADGLDGQAFHLVNPEPQPVVDAINLFCRAAGAPTFATPVDRSVTQSGPLGLVPRLLRPSTMVGNLVRSLPGQVLLDQTVGRLGIPAEVLGHTNFAPVFDSRKTEKALAGSGISVPDLESYARTLWAFWEESLDRTTGKDPEIRAALQGDCQGCGAQVSGGGGGQGDGAQHGAGDADRLAACGVAFAVVAVEERVGVTGVAQVGGGQLPAEVGGVVQAGVHAQAADGGVAVGGVADEEDAADAVVRALAFLAGEGGQVPHVAQAQFGAEQGGEQALEALRGGGLRRGDAVPGDDAVLSAAEGGQEREAVGVAGRCRVGGPVQDGVGDQEGVDDGAAGVGQPEQGADGAVDAVGADGVRGADGGAVAHLQADRVVVVVQAGHFGVGAGFQVHALVEGAAAQQVLGVVLGGDQDVGEAGGQVGEVEVEAVEEGDGGDACAGGQEFVGQAAGVEVFECAGVDGEGT